MAPRRCGVRRRVVGLPGVSLVAAGVERADSLVVNPHKWLLSPSTARLCGRAARRSFGETFSLTPEYLRTWMMTDSLSDYGPALGRRFRSLKLWAVIRCYGREGLQQAIREHVRLAELFEGWVRDEPGWELVAPRPFSVVCFRPSGIRRRQQAILERANATGEIFISHTKLDGRVALRLAVGQRANDRRRRRRAWDVLSRKQRAAQASAAVSWSATR